MLKGVKFLGDIKLNIWQLLQTGSLSGQHRQQYAAVFKIEGLLSPVLLLSFSFANFDHHHAEQAMAEERDPGPIQGKVIGESRA